MLQHRINDLIVSSRIPDIDEYLEILNDCVQQQEFKAAVFIYDHIKSNNIKPTKEVYHLIEKLHSKTLKNNDTLIIPTTGKHLDPRRRIHKIIKGYNYSSNYNSALQHIDAVKDYLIKNKANDMPSIENKNKLAKYISNNCNINIKDAKYIVTNLKRTKFFINYPSHNTITKYFTSL